jgi:hypothetical protein
MHVAPWYESWSDHSELHAMVLALLLGQAYRQSTTWDAYGGRLPGP